MKEHDFSETSAICFSESDGFVCNSLVDTEKTAKYFANFAKRGQCFALYGNLGFGKTTFAQYFIKALNPQIETVISPTFNIIQTYPSSMGEIWHVDCYRLDSKNEFWELGLDEAFSCCITVIEWPEIISDFLPQNTIRIKISKIDNRRIIKRLKFAKHDSEPSTLVDGELIH